MDRDSAFRPLRFEVLIGCTWVAARPEHIRKGAIFRVLTASGEPYHAAARVIPDLKDAGVYVASAHGTEHGVHFLAVPEVVELVVPSICPEA